MDASQARELETLEGILSNPSAEPTRLSYGLLKTITKNFTKEIGRGGFGVVYQGRWKNGVVAVKMISKAHNVPDKKFINEVKCLTRANHQNIVKFLGYCADIQQEIVPNNDTMVMAGDRNRLLCFEYIPNGNIREYLKKEKPHRNNWPARYQMIRGICHGLHYLHENRITHLDMKPENVMLDAHMTPKVTDFGLSRFLKKGQSTQVATQIIGTPRYTAPEYTVDGEISLMSDIYSLGIIIIEILTGISMIPLNNWEESLDMHCPGMGRCAEIARKCRQHDKGNRPTVLVVIRELDELQSIISRSSINQERPQSLQERTVIADHIIPARSLDIAWGDNPQFWTWTSPSDSRFGELAELVRVNYLKVSMNFEPKHDQPAANVYTAHLVYNLTPKTSGLQNTMQTARTHQYQVDITTSQVSLHPRAPGADRADGVTYPVARPDGWLELKLGELSTDKAVTVEIFHEDANVPTRGLIIKGMEVRRH